MKKITFLGTGAMGARMAQHLLEQYDVTVYNRTPSRADALVMSGAKRAKTPQEAVSSADFVISMVTDDLAADALWMHPEEGALHGLSQGTWVLESSTVTPTWIHRLADAVQKKGCHLLDAPVAGSTPQAEAKQLVFLVGGSEEDLEKARPIMTSMGSKIIHAGPQGHGAILKLTVNALFASQVALMAELLHMGEAQGFSPQKLTEALASTPVASPAAISAAQLMLTKDHTPRFPVALVAKDLRYAASLGDTPLITAALARFEAALRAGYSAENLTVVHLLEKNCLF